MKKLMNRFFWTLLIVHAIGVNIILAISMLFIQKYFSIYEYILIWLFSNQLNAFCFHLFDKINSITYSNQFPKNLIIIDLWSIYNSLIKPLQESNINGRFLFKLLIQLAFSTFVLFLVISFVNIFHEIYPITIEQSLFFYLVTLIMLYFIHSFNENLKVNA